MEKYEWHVLAFLERGHPKQMTKIKKRLVDEVKKENETPTDEVTAKKRENEDLKLANEKLKVQKHEVQGTRAGNSVCNICFL